MCNQAFAQGLDDGDAARRRRFELQSDAVFFRQIGQRLAMLGQQRLVGGYHMLAIGQRSFHQLARDALIAADQFDHDIGIAFGQR
jgi:hypothetical protein